MHTRETHKGLIWVVICALNKDEVRGSKYTQKHERICSQEWSQISTPMETLTAVKQKEDD